LPLGSGVCLAAIPRFGYDPVTARCRQFTYGGCGGNANNFATLAACEQACAHRAVRCRQCTGDTCVQGADCSACPVTRGMTGEACSVRGLECSFSGCGPICRCIEHDAGLAWACIALPC
jgi:hypothetical protein